MLLTKKREVLPAVKLENAFPEKEYEPFLLPLVRFAFSTLGRIFPKKAAEIAYTLFTTPRIRAVHKASDEILESARVFEFLYGKLLLKGYEWGNGEKKILLVHGWESRGTALRSFVPSLVAAGYKVIAFDGPAHGNSPGYRINLSGFAGAVLSIMRQVGGVQSIITHSFGGPTSVYALAHLDNSVEIDKMVFIAVPASTQVVVRQAMALMNLPKNAIAHFKNISTQKINKMPLEQADILHALEQVKVNEVLIVHDKNDNSVPFKSAEVIFEKYDHTSLLVTEGLGHSRLLKNPQVVNKVVEFIGPPSTK
jgi:esterase/lipase